MESLPAAKDKLELTVSRSGRIRKTSSKLVDFQLIKTKIECFSKRADILADIPNISGLRLPAADSSSPLSHIKIEEPLDILDPEPCIPESINDDNQIKNTEKSAKKKVFKDVKLKTQRTDKGKSRYTAYNLWSREVRNELITNEKLNFATISRRLGEMWKNVPANQKYNLRRRARRLTFKSKEKANTDSPAKLPVSKSTFFNRNPLTGQRTKFNHLEIDVFATTAMEFPVLSKSAVVKSATDTHLFGDSRTIDGLKEHEEILGL